MKHYYKFRFIFEKVLTTVIQFSGKKKLKAFLCKLLTRVNPVKIFDFFTGLLRLANSASLATTENDWIPRQLQPHCFHLSFLQYRYLFFYMAWLMYGTAVSAETVPQFPLTSSQIISPKKSPLITIRRVEKWLMPTRI